MVAAADTYYFKPCSCGAQMVMLKHERTGFVAPINVEAMPLDSEWPIGNVKVNLLAGTYRIIAKGSVELQKMSQAARAELRLNHYVTCPHRKEYRRRMGASTYHDVRGDRAS